VTIHWNHRENKELKRKFPSDQDIVQQTVILMTVSFAQLLNRYANEGPLHVQIGGLTMARIILNSEESFEHYHAQESKKIHIRGDIMISIGTASYKLGEGASIDTPRKTSHTITNIGQIEAEVGCVGLGEKSQHNKA
jgi:mannose-6-phosphate isomerase-like protein (cupin superfamily)